MSSFIQRAKPWVKRVVVIGGTTTALFIVAFPHFEDAYWTKKDPQRVQAGSPHHDKGRVDNEQGTDLSQQQHRLDSRKGDKKKLVILGTGWASISVLKHIDRDKYDVTIVSPRNYFLFTPLLPVRTSSRNEITGSKVYCNWHAAG